MSLRDRVAADYEASFGFVPEAVARRLRVWDEFDPATIEHVEAIRRIGTAPSAIDAKTALEYGMVNEVLPSDRLLARAWKLADHIMTQPRTTRRLTTQIVRRPWRQRRPMPHGSREHPARERSRRCRARTLDPAFLTGV